MRWTWLGLAVMLTVGDQMQHVQMPGTPSENLVTSRVFDARSLPSIHNPNGSERWDVVRSGRLATGEGVSIHTSMQPLGAEPGPAHTVQHSEFILVTEGVLEIVHDGTSERAGPGSVIYIAYGTMHQARNVGSGPVKYTVVAIGGDAK